MRPRSVPEIFDAAFALVRESYAPLATIAVLGIVPRLALYLLPPAVKPASGRILLQSLYNIGWAMVCSGALIVAADARYHGREPSVSAAIGVAARRFFALFFGGLGTYVMTVCGFVLLIVPGLILLVRYFAFVPAIAIEGLGVRAAVHRSRALSRGHGWRILAALFLPMLIYLPCLFGIGRLLLAAGMSARHSELVSSLTAALIAPFFAYVTVVLYYDVRIRTEAYDVELALRHTVAPAPTPTPTP